MLITNPLWVVTCTAEICNRLATMWFWGGVLPLVTPEPLEPNALPAAAP